MQTVKFSVVKQGKSTAVYLGTVKIISIGDRVRRYQADLTRHAELLARLAMESDTSLTLRAVAGPGVVSCVSPGGEPVVMFVRRQNWMMVFPTGRTIKFLRGESKSLEEVFRPLLSPETITIAGPDDSLDSLDKLPETVRRQYDAVFEAAQVLAGVAVYSDAEKADEAVGGAVSLALGLLRKANLIV